jgi:tetratricopeptide (TPR) repeat protein
MDRKQIWLTVMVIVLVIGAYLPVTAQPMPGEGNDMMRPDRGMQRPGMAQMQGHQGMPGRKRPGKRNPEMLKMMEKRNAMQAVAEAHKELALIYEEQKKIDEAAAELKKILDLFEETQKSENLSDEKGKHLLRKIIPVYHQIARLYLQNDRLDDAEKIMIEGIARFEKEEPHSASKLMIELSNIYKKNNKLAQAEELLKKVIKINQEALKE